MLAPPSPHLSHCEQTRGLCGRKFGAEMEFHTRTEAVLYRPSVSSSRVSCKSSRSCLKHWVVAWFDGEAITSDAGGVLLREAEARAGIIARFAGGFVDHRDPQFIEHSV